MLKPACELKRSRNVFFSLFDVFAALPDPNCVIGYPTDIVSAPARGGRLSNQ